MKNKLSEHFTLRELIYSSTAEANGINNTPDKHQLSNLTRLCENVLEPIRIEFDEQIFVTSGFRNPILNRLVGGANNSYHQYGLAVDIKSSNNKRLFNLIKKMMKEGKISIDQLIDEHNLSWIHIGIKENQKENRNEILEIN